MRTGDHPAVSREVPASDMPRRLTATPAARDATVLGSLFGTDLDIRALTPGGVWEARTPGELVSDVILGGGSCPAR